jgi:LmbE family N-acetylglucosaminyl deacetylase
MLAVHFAPHPDDELIGAPATLMALRDAGWRIVNVACSLGGPQQSSRRGAELREACGRARFDLRVPAQPVNISADCDPDAARADLTAIATEAIAELEPQLIVSPGPGDRHHGHQLVSEAVREALAAAGGAAPRLWMWALWGSLPQPTLGTRFDPERLAEVLNALEAHCSQLARTDYRRVVRARAELNASLAPELLFGFGDGGAPEAPYAELLTEVLRENGRWLLARSRWLDPTQALCGAHGGEVAVSWT